MSGNNEPWVDSTSFNQLSVESNDKLPIHKLVLKSDGTVEEAKVEPLPSSKVFEAVEVSLYEDFYPTFALILFALSLGTGISMTVYTANIFIGFLCGLVVLISSVFLLKIIAPDSQKEAIPSTQKEKIVLPE